MSRNSALKVIDHALSGKEGIENCEKFVEILGLRTLFPLFMKTPKRNKKSGHTENVSRPRRFHVSAFRVGPAASGRGLCDIGRVLFRVAKSRVKKLGSPCATKNIPITWVFGFYL